RQRPGGGQGAPRRAVPETRARGALASAARTARARRGTLRGGIARMTRTLAIALAVLTTVGFLLAGGAARSAIFGGNRGQRVSDLITEIDLAAAEKLLTEPDSGAPAVAFERARLAVYRGDCVLGSALLSGAALSETKEGAALKELAENCARA